MLNFIKKFLAPPIFSDSRKTYEASNINTILNLAIIIGFSSLPIVIILGLAQGRLNPSDPVNLILIGTLFFAHLLKFVLLKGYVRFVSAIYIIAILIISLWMVVLQNTIVNTITVIVILPIILAIFLIGRNAGLAVLAIVMAFLFWISSQSTSGMLGAPSPTTPINQWIIFFINVIVLFGISNLFKSNLLKALDIAQKNEQIQSKTNIELQGLQKNLELRVNERTQELKERTSQLGTIAEVARSIASIQEMDQLLTQVTEL
ncbi:MAG: hypothetical protein KAH38_01395, partial [Candidatus Hydrogenedentes bacterium]|nr:hypothetical protein [Candidatus Hydrogenedentota bacterium]